jgi:phosphoglucosamine mutase
MNSTLNQLLEAIPLFPQCLLNISIPSNLDWRTHTELQSRIKSVEKELGANGRVLIRESGTEPLLRIMVEAREEELSVKYASFLAEALSQI